MKLKGYVFLKGYFLSVKQIPHITGKKSSIYIWPQLGVTMFIKAVNKENIKHGPQY